MKLNVCTIIRATLDLSAFFKEEAFLYQNVNGGVTCSLHSRYGAAISIMPNEDGTGIVETSTMIDGCYESTVYEGPLALTHAMIAVKQIKRSRR
jgi:hypothetical protein